MLQKNFSNAKKYRPNVLWYWSVVHLEQGCEKMFRNPITFSTSLNFLFSCSSASFSHTNTTWKYVFYIHFCQFLDSNCEPLMTSLPNEPHNHLFLTCTIFFILGRGDVQVFSVLTFYSDDPSLNLAKNLQFFCQICAWKRTKIIKKWLVPFLNKTSFLVKAFLLSLFTDSFVSCSYFYPRYLTLVSSFQSWNASIF